MPLCGWASIDERGKLKGGVAGDQKQKSSTKDTVGEVKLGNWYNFSYTFVLRYKDRKKAKKHAAALKFFCNSKFVGYDQNQRTTLCTEVKRIGLSNYKKLAKNVETDCSALQDLCAMIAGVKLTWSPATAAMVDEYKKTGEFKVLTDKKYLTSGDYLMEGDILVRPGHHTIGVLENGPKAITPSEEKGSSNSTIKKGLKYAESFTGKDDSGNLSKAKGRVLQHALNLDYGESIKEDGVIGDATKEKLGSHYVKKGESQFMVTAAEILMYLNEVDAGGVETPGKYGSGLVSSVKKVLGGTGEKITASDFLKLVK